MPFSNLKFIAQNSINTFASVTWLPHFYQQQSNYVMIMPHICFLIVVCQLHLRLKVDVVLLPLKLYNAPTQFFPRSMLCLSLWDTFAGSISSSSFHYVSISWRCHCACEYAVAPSDIRKIHSIMKRKFDFSHFLRLLVS